MFRREFTLYLVLLLVFTNTLTAQVDWSHFESFKQYQEEDGFSLTAMKIIREDPYGFLWIGLKDGVARFDGSHFEHFSSFKVGAGKKPMGLVTDISFDPNGKTIFLATYFGVLESSLQKIEFKPLWERIEDSEIKQKPVNTVYCDSDNNIWAGIVGDGLTRINLNNLTIKSFIFEAENERATHSELNFIKVVEHDLVDPDLLWIGTAQGIVKLNSKTGIYNIFYFKNNPNTLHNSIEEIAQSKSSLFIGTFKKGWYIFDKRSEEFFQPVGPDSEHYQEFCPNIYLDNDKFLWISTPLGLIQYDLGAKRAVKNNIGRLESGISLIDSRGIIWNVMHGNLYRFDTNRFIRFISFLDWSEVSQSIVLNIIRIGDNYYVCPYYGEGIFKINPRNGSVKTIPIPQLPYRGFGAGYLFRDMETTAEGNLIILGDNRMVLLDTANDTTFDPPVQLPDSVMVYRGSITRDHTDNYWVATHTSGLFKINFDNKSVENYTEQFKGLNAREHRYLKELYTDSRNRLWIGQASTSVMDLKSYEVKCLNPEFEYERLEVFGKFYEDKDQNMWIANWVDGIGFVDGKKPEDGILRIVDGSFTGIYPFRDSLMWTIGNRGLGIFNAGDNTHRLIKLNSQNQFTGPIVSMGEGDYMIGCFNGIQIYNPNRHRSMAGEPELYIREVRANNRAVPIDISFGDRKLEFPSGTRALSVTLGSLTFADAESFTYQFKIDEDWIDLGRSREVNLSNLSQGYYNLAVRPVNAFGEKLPTTYYTFKVNPFWYTSNLAIAIYVLLIIALIFAFYKFNLNRKLAVLESKQAKALDEVKSKMYANISHEFRTPLTLIKGFTGMLQKSNGSLPDRDLLQGIDHSSNQLLSLVDQMLDLASLDTDKMVVKYKNGDVISFIREIVNLFKSYSDSRSQKLEFQSDVQKLIMDFDDEKLQKILNNILSNAIKFTQDGGHIMVNVKKLGSEIGITVIDNGQGIERDDLPYLFERHFTKSDIKGGIGSGIGLALTKELVHLLKGEITVSSEVGRGSQFKIVLPVTNNSKDTDIALHLPFVRDNVPTPSSRDFAPKKEDKPVVLIVEDNKSIRDFLGLLLQDYFRIEFAINGVEGIEIAAIRIIDFIICDVMMPVMDGFEFCRKVKSDIKTSHIPFIMLTARTSAEDKRMAYELGVDAYLIKPFDPEELILIMRNLLNQKAEKSKYLRELLSIKKPERLKASINQLDLDLVKNLQFLILESKLASADEIARELFISRSQLHRKIKALTGMSLTAYGNHVRIEKAKHLLNTTNMNVSEIAYEVGFDDPSYFSRTFKKLESVSPKSYRTDA